MWGDRIRSECSKQSIGNSRATSASHTKLKIRRKISPVRLNEHIMQKDFTYLPNLERYAETICLFISFRIICRRFLFNKKLATSIPHTKIYLLMKTLYLVKSLSNNISFECDTTLGLQFIESAVDIKFLNNVLFDQRLKLYVEQKSGDQWVGKATIWFILLTDAPLNNKNLEKELTYIRNIGNQLFQLTKLGQKFSYKDIYSIPNISDSWKIEDIHITLYENGDFKEVYCLNKDKVLGNDGDDIIYEASALTVKADLVVCVVSENQRTQSQFIHVTLPPQNINFDTSSLRTTGDLEPLNCFHGIENYRGTRGMIFELYNNAITADSIFTSFLLLFQIVELIIDAAQATKIDGEIISLIINEINKIKLIDAIFIDRVRGSLLGLKKELSHELLKSGTIALVGELRSREVDFSNFSSWRKLRGKITHPKNTQELTDSEFVAQYKTLRIFVDGVALALSTNNG